ncbi:MAG: hypothetical protein Unbinned92contig1002_17 [Prokaryotic dsDNA virus sp.]|nr:MAG: hypothetical protein Unbinned92contig1002_17 [Prokaryotic dsDNA virus sp.]|tara:strand:- start:29868 stop:30116 length:249 start_codon:yes stop_codon:yes gene_type:complete
MAKNNNTFEVKYILNETMLLVKGTYSESEPGDHFHPGFPAELNINGIYLDEFPKAEVTNIINDYDYEQIEDDLYQDLIDGNL